MQDPLDSPPAVPITGPIRRPNATSSRLEPAPDQDNPLHARGTTMSTEPGGRDAAIAYRLGDSLYLNITSACTLACRFCAKFRSPLLDSPRSPTGKLNLGLGSFTPDAETVVAAALAARSRPWVSANQLRGSLVEANPSLRGFDEVVFVGFGEPTREWETLILSAERLRRHGARRLRLDTDGLASLRQGEDVVPTLAKLFDAISVSLNAQDAPTYVRYCPNRYGEAAWSACCDFVARASAQVPWVQATAVDLPEVDADACRELAERLGARFKLRALDALG